MPLAHARLTHLVRLHACKYFPAHSEFECPALVGSTLFLSHFFSSVRLSRSRRPECPKCPQGSGRTGRLEHEVMQDGSIRRRSESARAIASPGIRHSWASPDGP